MAAVGWLAGAGEAVAGGGPLACLARHAIGGIDDWHDRPCGMASAIWQVAADLGHCALRFEGRIHGLLSPRSNQTRLGCARMYADR